MFEQIENYAKHLSASTEVMQWLSTTGKKALTNQKVSISDLEHILDYLVSNAAPKRLQKMSIKAAQENTKKWTNANVKKGRHLEDSSDDIETVHDFLDGTRIVKLKSKQALQREGFLMSHCVGSYDALDSTKEIYSYRDAKNVPHATFEVNKLAGQIMQIKGKGNGPIHPKYIHPILAFLNVLKIQIRPSEMVNLGYYHVNKQHLNFLELIPTARKQLVVISGENYAFVS